MPTYLPGICLQRPSLAAAPQGNCPDSMGRNVFGNKLLPPSVPRVEGGGSSVTSGPQFQGIPAALGGGALQGSEMPFRPALHITLSRDGHPAESWGDPLSLLPSLTLNLAPPSRLPSRGPGRRGGGGRAGRQDAGGGEARATRRRPPPPARAPGPSPACARAPGLRPPLTHGAGAAPGRREQEPSGTSRRPSASAALAGGGAGQVAAGGAAGTRTAPPRNRGVCPGAVPPTLLPAASPGPEGPAGARSRPRAAGWTRPPGRPPRRGAGRGGVGAPSSRCGPAPVLGSASLELYWRANARRPRLYSSPEN